MALAGPNLVANGDLNRPAKQAEMHVNLLTDGVYFSFDGQDHFGRVVVTGTDDWRAYRDMVVAFRELGLPGTGGMRGLVVSMADVDTPEVPGTVYIWFDLRGKVRPNRTYEYEFQGFGGGQRADEGTKLTVIAPAIWVDGKPAGAEFDVTFGGGFNTKKGRIQTGDFGKQTASAGLVIVLPEEMSSGILLRRVVFREVDDARAWLEESS